MAMGTRKQERQQEFWIATKDVVEPPGNAFYDRLNKILDEHRFDRKVETLCRKFYKKSRYGRPSMAPGVYFRALLIGYFEGLDSERGIAWRVADSLSLRRRVPYVGLSDRREEQQRVAADSIAKRDLALSRRGETQPDRVECGSMAHPTTLPAADLY
jgi:transposase